ncbi:MAG TPA: hypothetical protein VGM05_20070 [Planctomycetaceae bacterium]
MAACCKSMGAAIRLAELFAAGNDVDADELATTEEWTVRAVVVASEICPPNERAAYAANAAYATLCAVKAAFEVKGCQSPADDAERVARAAAIARDSAISADEHVERMARLDCEMLHRMPLGHFPDFGEPIDAGEHGQLGALFQDLSRGTRCDTQPTSGGVEGRRRSKSAASGRRRIRNHTELSALPPANAWDEQAAEIDALRQQIEADRLQFQADRAAFDAERQALQKQLECQISKLEQQRATYTKQAEQLATEREALNAEARDIDEIRQTVETERQTLKAASKALHEASLAIGDERLEIQAAFDSLEDERCELLELRLLLSPASPQS